MTALATLDKTPARRETVLEGTTRRAGTLDVSWVWTRGDGIWWCRDCRCRVLYGRCMNFWCWNALR